MRGALGDDAAASRHFIQTGAAEGRSLSFDALNYTATYGDLRAAFSADASTGARHYVLFGEAEGRRPGFDAYGYLAGNTAVLQVAGPDPAEAALHYITVGADLGYWTDAFDALRYSASYADLSATFGLKEAAATGHFVLAAPRLNAANFSDRAVSAPRL